MVGYCMIYCGNLEDNIVEYVAELCAKNIYRYWPDEIISMKQLRPYVNPATKNKVIWVHQDILMG